MASAVAVRGSARHAIEQFSYYSARSNHHDSKSQKKIEAPMDIFATLEKNMLCSCVDLSFVLILIAFVLLQDFHGRLDFMKWERGNRKDRSDRAKRKKGNFGSVFFALQCKSQELKENRGEHKTGRRRTGATGSCDSCLIH